MSETTWESIIQNYKTRAVRDGSRIDELRQSTEHWYDTAQMLKRQRDTAEEDREGWKERAMKAEQQRQALRVECDALRKDAARLREAIDIFISFQGSTREPEGQAALDAALAVQP